MSQHTPGPWAAILVGKFEGYKIEGPNSEPIVEEGYGPRGANARLIAAAPDLLAALEAAVRVWIPEHAAEAALAAIRRATTETP